MAGWIWPSLPLASVTQAGNNRQTASMGAVVFLRIAEREFGFLVFVSAGRLAAAGRQSKGILALGFARGMVDPRGSFFYFWSAFDFLRGFWDGESGQSF